MTTSTLTNLVPDVDVDQASRHLRLLHGQSEGYLSIVLMRERKVAWTFANSAEALQPCSDREGAIEALQDASSDGWNVYTAVADFKHVPEKGRGNTGDVLSIPGVWADIDVKPGLEGFFQTETEALDYLATLPPPTLEVASGSGGRHVYWLCRNGRLTIGYAKWILEVWRDYLHAMARGLEIDAVQDPARVLRLAGTIRWPKHGETINAQPVRLIKDDGPYYYYDELKVEAEPAWMAAQEVRDAARRRAAESRAERQRLLESYGDVAVRTMQTLVANFNHYQDWEPMLTSTGWTLFADDRGRHANCRYWTRPGKATRDGKSAATDYTTDEGFTSPQMTIYTEEPTLNDIVEAITPAGRRVCSKYHYAKQRLFGGDEQALLEELHKTGGVLS